VNPIRIDRFSAYFQRYRDYGWDHIEPVGEYRMLHPRLDDTVLRDLAYHFDGIGGVSSTAYFERFAAAVNHWQQRHLRGDGLFLDPVRGLVRNEAGRGTRFSLNDTMQRVLDCTHDIAPIGRVLEHARCPRSLLERMAELGLLHVEADKVVNLTVRTQVAERIDQ
jgi:hypothetical protein